MASRILLAGGGTAGHIEPALAVADQLKKIHPSVTCEFLGTDGALEQLLVPQRGYQMHTIEKVALPRKLDLKAFLFPMRLLGSVRQAMKALDGADLLIGFGGYVAAPAYIAAFIKRVPIVIHEANAKPGWANRLGKNFAKLVAVNFETVRREWPGSVLTGMPIRESISALATSNQERVNNLQEIRNESCKNWSLNPKLPIVAIFGGSQGSMHINQVVAEALPSIPDLQILHAVGIKNPLPDSSQNYRPFPYFHDMAAIYASADLLITRSGAVTCSEISALGKYAILIPLPHGNGEQLDNAQALAKKGSALVIPDKDFSATWLAENIRTALDNALQHKPEPSVENLDAAQRIAKLALQVIGVNSISKDSASE